MQFISSLKDNLNAEVALGTVTNVKEACAWLGYTYLFIRMKMNPLAYGIGWDEVSLVLTTFIYFMQISTTVVGFIDTIYILSNAHLCGVILPVLICVFSTLDLGQFILSHHVYALCLHFNVCYDCKADYAERSANNKQIKQTSQQNFSLLSKLLINVKHYGSNLSFQFDSLLLMLVYNFRFCIYVRVCSLFLLLINFHFRQ